MEAEDSRGKIVKEAVPAEIISIIGDILAGIALTFLILPFESFILLIIIIPALLSLRGNLSGPFIARTSRDLIVGDFNKRTFTENILATYALSIITSIMIGILTIIINYLLFDIKLLSNQTILLIPIISIIMELSLSMPTSTIMNIISFKYGYDPNNIVNPIMTALDDFFTVICFYISLIILGVP
ncbi:MAG: magnesium transporter [Promethearchaeia archaeon]